MFLLKRRNLLVACCLALAGIVTGASGEAKASIVFGLRAAPANQIVFFESSNPGTLLGTFNVTGLPAGAVLQGIDFRPASGGTQLIGLTQGGPGVTGRVFDINTNTGAATLLNTFTPLNGTAFGFDFNPVPDALRIVNNVEQNLRITAGGAGVVNTDGTINQSGVAAGAIGLAAAAYSDNVPGGTAGNTTLFVIDAQRGLLLTQGTRNFPGGPPAPGISPNTGTLLTVGSLGLGTNLTTQIGFDISADGEILASFGNTIRSINTTTGAAGPVIGTVPGGALRDIAISAIPEPTSIALVGLGLAGLAGYRLRRRKA